MNYIGLKLIKIIYKPFLILMTLKFCLYIFCVIKSYDINLVLIADFFATNPKFALQTISCLFCMKTFKADVIFFFFINEIKILQRKHGSC